MATLRGMTSKRRARRTSKQRSEQRRTEQRPPPPAFTEVEEAFFAAGIAASESGQFEGISGDAEEPRPGLLRRFLLRVQRA